MLIEVTPKEKTALGVLFYLKQKFAREQFDKEMNETLKQQLFNVNKIIDEFPNPYPQDIFKWDNKEKLNFDRGAFNKFCFNLVENIKGELKSQINNYDLVNRNNVTGQTVKGANHTSPSNKRKRASPQKSGRAYILIKKAVKPKRCKKCNRILSKRNKSGLCNKHFNINYTQSEEYKEKRRIYFRNYRAKKKKEKYS